MATKDKKTPAKKAETTSKVTRISAKDDTKPAAKAAKTPKKATPVVAVSATDEKKKRRNPIVAIGAYFAGAWYELRQVRWPNRKATWSLTLAVLAFTAFFMVLILLLDALFKYLFELILG